MIATELLERQRLSLVAAFSLALAASPAAFAAGDATRGAKVFQVCAACHSTKRGENMTGPSLAAIWARKAGTVPGFDRYSEALKRSGVTWNAATLDAWLRDPAHFIPGNAMGALFPGLPNAKERADVIAFLEALAEGKTSAPGGGMMSVHKGDLRRPPPDAQVRSITFCGDTYTVATADGETHEIWDFNLRFKTDASAHGPAPGNPVLLGAGMRGDRAFVVFASPAEISGFVWRSCPRDRREGQ